MEKETKAFKESAIAIMLDVQGTIDDIKEDTARIFMQQLQELRRKYKAEKVIINLSSHMSSKEGLIPYLEILHRTLSPNIILGTSFYLFGTYNYEKGEDVYKGLGYNLKKEEVFENCLDSKKYDRICMGLIDDSISPNYIAKFQHKEPIFIIRPSQKGEEKLQKDNLMCHSTQTKGFDGVLEGMDSYLHSIKDIPFEKIVEEQIRVLLPIDEEEVANLCDKRNFSLLYRYLMEREYTTYRYRLISFKLNKLFENGVILEKEELELINKIIQVLKEHINMKDEIENKYLLNLISRNVMFY